MFDPDQHGVASQHWRFPHQVRQSNAGEALTPDTIVANHRGKGMSRIATDQVVRVEEILGGKEQGKLVGTP